VKGLYLVVTIAVNDVMLRSVCSEHEHCATTASWQCTIRKIKSLERVFWHIAKRLFVALNDKFGC
jgi:hypothetical protein